MERRKNFILIKLFWIVNLILGSITGSADIKLHGSEVQSCQSNSKETTILDPYSNFYMFWNNGIEPHYQKLLRDSDPVGKIEGHFEVTDDGAATYFVPLITPPVMLFAVSPMSILGVVPVTCNLVRGVEVPMPSLLLALSQYRSLSPVIVSESSQKATCPAAPEPSRP